MKYLLKFFIYKLFKFYSNTMEIDSRKHKKIQMWRQIFRANTIYSSLPSVLPCPPAFKRKAIALNQLFFPEMSFPHNAPKSTSALLRGCPETGSRSIHYNGKKAPLPKPALMLWAELASNSSWVNPKGQYSRFYPCWLPSEPSKGNWGTQPNLLK